MLLASIVATSLSMPAFAAMNSFDIEIRVYDESTGRLISNVGTDTFEFDDSTGYIESDRYTIPSLSEFTSNSYGSVTEVTGNWYRPSRSSNVGSEVIWSVNTGTKAITYKVTDWQSGTGAGSGSTSNTTEEIGAGSKTWTQTIAYHSNYPDGTDYVQTRTYNVKSYTTIYSTYNALSLAELGFSNPDGYVQGNIDENGVYPWNKSADGTGANVNKSISLEQSMNGQTLHVYAQWVPVNSEVVEEVTLTSKDGASTYAQQSYFAGDTAFVPDCDIYKDGQDFAGWDTDESADNVVYEAGDGFGIDEDTTVYAVWTTRQAPDTIILTYNTTGGENGPSEEDSSVEEGNEATFTISNTIPTRDGYTFMGWSTTEDGEVEYEAGDEFKATTDSTLYAVWEVEVSETVELIYNSKGGENGPTTEDSGIAEGQDATFNISNTKPTRDGYTFMGWATTDGGDVVYSGGEELVVNTDTTLYAVWELEVEKISEPGMDKKAEDTDVIGEVEPDDVINFTLNSHVGEDLVDTVTNDGTTCTGTYDLVFKDTLTGPATIDFDSFVVTVGGDTLDESYYAIEENPDDGASFHLTIDVVELLNNDILAWENVGVAEVVVAYSATVDSEAEHEEEIRNDAQVNDSVVDTVTGTINNPTPPPEIPETGSSAALAYTGVGIALVGVGFILLKVKKKDEEEETTK